MTVLIYQKGKIGPIQSVRLTKKLSEYSHPAEFLASVFGPIVVVEIGGANKFWHFKVKEAYSKKVIKGYFIPL